MPIVHFLNVDEGDCSIIEHLSNRISVIDVCNAYPLSDLSIAHEKVTKGAALLEKGVNGNYNQKEHPTNPIAYMFEHGITKVFRFILTYTDADHMDGIEAFFNAFNPTNFWDTANTEEKTNWSNKKYKESDWKFYKSLRDGQRTNPPTRLTLYSGSKNKYFNIDENGNQGSDGLYILAPTPTLIAAANESEEYNDASYVILYRTHNHRILFAGDSHDATWEHILKHHKADVTNVDVLIAPHHGRDSSRDWAFLSEVNPALTLVGNAPAKHMGYFAWNNRKLPFITNNQAGSVIINAGVDPMEVFVTCKSFAEAANPWNPMFVDWAKGYYWGEVTRAKAVGA